MRHRSGPALKTVVKTMGKVLSRPWVARGLFDLEKDKVLFDFLRPDASLGAGGKIRQVSLRITDRCNLRCRTCGQWGERGFLHGQDPRELAARELPPERYIELLDDLAAHGNRPVLYLWGGEPMLYRGALDILEHAAGLRMPTAVATNGTGLAGAAARLAAMPMFLLQVSIDGHDAATHNAARPAAGKGDNFRDIREGLAAVREEKARRNGKLPLVAALTTLSKANVEHLPDIYETFRKEVDLFVVYLAWWIDEAGAAAHEADFSRRFGFAPRLHRGWIGTWPIEDFELAAARLRELRRRSAPLSEPAVHVMPNLATAEDLCRYYTDHSARFGFERCLSIFHAAELDSNGDMSPCRDYHDYVVGNAREQTITELWNNEAYRKFRADLHGNGLMPVCSRCCGLMGY